jgi:steroid delta-isomerase-like uncharacterized protein
MANKYLPIVLSVIGIIIFNINSFSQNKTKMTTDMKAIATQFYTEVINKGDTGLMKAIMSENFIDHYAAANQPQGPEGFKQFLTMVATAFPDIQVKVEDIIAEGNKAVVRLSIMGTHTGMLMGSISPTGKQASWTGIDILTIENGKITERWSLRDLLGMMKQIGVVK